MIIQNLPCRRTFVFLFWLMASASTSAQSLEPTPIFHYARIPNIAVRSAAAIQAANEEVFLELPVAPQRMAAQMRGAPSGSNAIVLTRVQWAPKLRISGPDEMSAAWQQAYDALYSTYYGPKARAWDLTPVAAEPSVAPTPESEMLEETSAHVALQPGAAPPPIEIGKKALGAWPKPPKSQAFDWHLEKSELRAALAMVDTQREGFRPARIGLMDNQFDVNEHLLLRSFVALQESDPVSYLPKEGRGYVPRTIPGAGGFFGSKSHGSGMLALLAADFYRDAPDYGIYHGANPHANVVGLRGFRGVAHLFDVSAYARAITTAADEGCEIFSASHGGLPSGSLYLATEYAYQRGMAMFTAAGNSYQFFYGFPRIPASFVVFPAAYDTVIGVLGMSHAERPYSRQPGWNIFRGGWYLRGNSGPAEVMPRMVAAYTPNIARPEVDLDSSEMGAIVNLHGSGTSSATPQVAGAASLWLEHYREKLDRIVGTDPADRWKRAEYIYQAVLRGCRDGGPPDHVDLGEGKLRAGSILRQDPDTFTELANHSGRRPHYGLLRLLLSGLIPSLPSGAANDGELRARIMSLPAASVEFDPEAIARNDRFFVAFLESAELELMQLAWDDEKAHRMAVQLEALARKDGFTVGSAVNLSAETRAQAEKFAARIRRHKNCSPYLQALLRLEWPAAFAAAR